MIEYESLARSNAPFLDELEQAAVRVIRSGWYVLGQEAAAFESEFAAYVPTKNLGALGGAGAITTDDRDALREYLLAAGIKTEVHCPIPPHRQEAMNPVLGGDYPVADRIHATQISLPISVAHSLAEIHAVSEAAGAFLSRPV